MTPSRRLYRQGHCDAMALALHRVTGLPLVALTGERRDPKGGWCREEAHVAVAVRHQRNEGALTRWIDVDGIHQGIPSNRLLFLRPPDRIRILPITEQRVRFLYTKSGVKEAEIFQAMDFISKDESLMKLVRRFIKKP